MHYHQHDGCGPQSVDGIVKWALVYENDKRISFRKKLKEFMTSNQGPGVRSKVFGKKQNRRFWSSGKTILLGMLFHLHSRRVITRTSKVN